MRPTQDVIKGFAPTVSVIHEAGGYAVTYSCNNTRVVMLSGVRYHEAYARARDVRAHKARSHSRPVRMVLMGVDA